MYDIITIGSATRDVFLASEKFIAIKSRKFSTGTGECMSLGSKIEIHELLLTTGGGATNAAATFGSMGFRTAIMTRVGDDSPGKDVVEDLSRFGVSSHLVRIIKGGQTAYATLLTMEGGERTALVYRGVSAEFTQRDIPLKALKTTKWLYLTSLGGNIALTKKIILHAKKMNVSVAWNPGSSEIEAGLTSILPLVQLTDVLNINREEAQLLTKKKKLEEMFEILHTDGMVRVITDGADGATAYRDGWTAHASTKKIDAISRTGAGDAFGSGFVAGLMKTQDIREALCVGTLNAESVIQQYGAKKGILSKWPSKKQLKHISITQS